MMDYNSLPVHVGWAYEDDPFETARENADTYERLKEVCVFSESPLGCRTVIRDYGNFYGQHRFRLLCNHAKLDDDHIALFCDRGDLSCGYRRDGNMIFIDK